MLLYHVAVLILITHIDTEKDLYCPYKTLVKSYENPSAFCQLSGNIIVIQTHAYAHTMNIYTHLYLFM